MRGCGRLLTSISNRPLRAVLVVLATAAAACSNAQGPAAPAGNPEGGTAQGKDAGIPDEPTLPELPELSEPSEIGAGASDCPDGSRAEGIDHLPMPGASIFSHVASACRALSSTMLIFNTEDIPLSVGGMLVEPDVFTLPDAPSLPFEVPGRSSFAISLRYTGDVVGDHVGRLVVSTDRGCHESVLVGVATDGPLMSFTDLAIDFGAVEPGETSALHEVQIQGQGSGLDRVVFSRAGAGPNGFEVVSSRQASFTLSDCESTTVGLRFSPSSDATPGQVDGALSWGLTITAEDGSVAAGDTFVPLVGTVLEAAN